MPAPQARRTTNPDRPGRPGPAAATGSHPDCNGSSKPATGPACSRLRPTRPLHRQRPPQTLARRRDQVTVSVEKAEARIHEINELFCDPTFFDRTSRDQVKKLENEQKTLSGQVEGLMGEWEKLEEQIAELGAS